MHIQHKLRVVAIILAISVLLTIMPNIAIASSEISITSVRADGTALSVTEGSAPEIVQGSTIEIEGTVSPGGKDVTYIVVPVGSVSPICAIGQAESNSATGAFSMSVALPAVMTVGTYEIRISGEEASGVSRYYFKIQTGLEKRIVLSSSSDSIKYIGASLTVEAEIINRFLGDVVDWSVESGSDVVSVSGGVVTALKEGTAVIKAALRSNSNVYAKKTIIVDTTDFGDISLVTSANGSGRIMYDTSDYSSHTGEHDVGSEFELEAEAEGGSVFLYWVDERSGRIVSEESRYSFILGTAMTLSAVFKEDTDPALVMFIEKNKKLHKWSADNEGTVPNDPFIMGYTFDGWKKDGESRISSYRGGDVIAAGTISEDAIFRAQHTLNAETYTVTIINGVGAESGVYQYNTKISLTPAEAVSGKKFAYWRRDGQIVSYNESYTFYVASSETTVEAVYEDLGSSTAVQPVLIISEPVFVEKTEKEYEKYAFFAERNLPEQYTLIEAGIIMASGLAEESSLSLSTYTQKAVSTSKSKSGQYTVRKSIPEGEKWTARAYMIYKDGDNVITMYSDPVSKYVEVTPGNIEYGEDY